MQATDHRARGDEPREPADLRGPEPAPLAPDDAVPTFRHDLRVERGASPGLFDVSDPRSGRRLTLYEFEVAIARMLDGRRPASEVVEVGGSLGIPVDLVGLYKFVRQLWSCGFLAPPGAPPPQAGGASWEARERWDEATRALYQAGVRLVRLGRPADAASYFEAILDAHPGNAEAAEMLAVIANGRATAATPIGSREPAPRARRRGAIVAAAAALAAAAAGAAWVRGGSFAAEPPPADAPAVAAPAPRAAEEPAPVPAEPPPPRWRSAPIETRRHPVLAEVPAPAAGSVRWRRDAGATVRAGERIAELRADAGGAPGPELARRIAELEALAARDPVYAEFLERARAEARSSSRRARAVPIRAPAAGTLVRVAERPARAAAGEVLGRVVDPSRWQLGAALDGDPGAAPECEVVGDAPSERAPCRVVSARGAGDRRTELTVEIAAADAPWIGRAQSPWLRLAPTGSEGP